MEPPMITERESDDLPECAVVPEHDFPTRDALVREGWRYIGTRITYEKRCLWKFGRRSRLVRQAQPGEVLSLAEQIPWGGRYWRDPEVSDDAAWRQLRHSIISTPDDVYMLKNAAFAIIVFGIVCLVGVHPAASGLGLGRTLLKHALYGENRIKAGTYADNKGARRLYESLGMRPNETRAVYHK